MKKILRITLSLFLVMILTVNLFNVQAVTVSEEDWISKALSDYEPLQSMLEQYPNAEKVQSNIKYVLTETIKDKDGEILNITQKNFDNLSKMQNYEEQLVEINNITPYVVGDGETKYKTYTKMRVGLALYKYNSNRFFVAFVYDWLTQPDYDALLKYKGVVGLALDSGLSMDGTSYAGRVTMKIIDGSTIMRNTQNGGVNIKATGTQGIGYKIEESAQNTGLILEMEGVISCEAIKTSSNIIATSAFGEYAYVGFTPNLNSFSVSFPKGVSFGIGTTKTPYTYQDALDLR
ncbi:hypothetical protein [Sedimentibacter sp.]|uniref:hypothetical protein n=1 Tax=Sedimentibacter sp. TaxID=1960295 RepID=UPI00289B1A33|nr:hypothetical protein [Sedimentibacter sp.]